MKLPTIGYLGAFPDGDVPIVPCLFRRGKQLHASDGSKDLGPFDSEVAARCALTLALVKRQRRRFEWGFLFLFSAAICVMCLFLAL